MGWSERSVEMLVECSERREVRRWRKKCDGFGGILGHRGKKEWKRSVKVLEKEADMIEAPVTVYKR